MRIVLDTNVLISMILGGRLGRLIDHWDQKHFAIVEIPIMTPHDFLNLLERKS